MLVSTLFALAPLAGLALGQQTCAVALDPMRNADAFTTATFNGKIDVAFNNEVRFARPNGNSAGVLSLANGDNYRKIYRIEGPNNVAQFYWLNAGQQCKTNLGFTRVIAAQWYVQ
ncbi:hypothetical protein EsH8_IV_001185 [Colletotrichum jinshuiense]